MWHRNSTPHWILYESRFNKKYPNALMHTLKVFKSSIKRKTDRNLIPTSSYLCCDWHTDKPMMLFLPTSCPLGSKGTGTCTVSHSATMTYDAQISSVWHMSKCYARVTIHISEHSAPSSCVTLSSTCSVISHLSLLCFDVCQVFTLCIGLWGKRFMGEISFRKQ